VLSEAVLVLVIVIEVLGITLTRKIDYEYDYEHEHENPNLRAKPLRREGGWKEIIGFSRSPSLSRGCR
jgi:hypothetical protein